MPANVPLIKGNIEKKKLLPQDVFDLATSLVLPLLEFIVDDFLSEPPPAKDGVSVVVSETLGTVGGSDVVLPTYSLHNRFPSGVCITSLMNLDLWSIRYVAHS